MEVELDELKRFCIITFKGSKGKQLIEFNECWTFVMKFGKIGKTMTSNEELVFWKSLAVL